jgi:hypothetical protein
LIGHLGFLNQVSNQISLQVAHFDPESLAHFDPDLVAHFNPESLAHFNPDLVAHFNPESVAHFNPEYPQNPISCIQRLSSSFYCPCLLFPNLHKRLTFNPF